MMRSKALVALVGAALIFSPPVALALDVGSSAGRSLVDCDDLRRGATEAQARYVHTYTPRVDPVKTFDDATGSCLEFISMFDIGFSFTIPSIGDLDALLRSMAMKLLQRACQAATQQFNRAVNDAVQSVNAPLAQVAGNVPGVSGGISTGSGSAGVTIKDDGGSTVRNTINNATDRVINFVR
jgi:hypothetical protein